MKNAAVILLASVVSAAVLAAQAPSTPAQTQPPPPPDGSTATVTGCLRAGEQPDTYVLTNVRWSSTNVPTREPAAHHDATPRRDRPDAPATAASGQRETPAPGETLRLAGAATRLKIKDHLGHTVTLTGMVGPQDPIVRPGVLLPDPPARGDTTSRTSPAREKTPPEPRVLNVRSITHVTDTCK